MSYIVGNYINCPELQNYLVGHFGQLSGIYREGNAFTEFLASSTNTSGVIQRQIDLRNSKYRTVQLVYENRFHENQVTNSAIQLCTAEDEPAELVEIYELNPQAGSSFQWKIALTDLHKRCEEDEMFFARQVQKGIDVLTRKINTDNWNKALSLFGIFPTTTTNAAITVATKNSDDVYIPDALEKVEYEFAEMDYIGPVALFGGSELFKNYFRSMAGMCNNTTLGVDIPTLFASKSIIPFYDRKANSTLGSNQFLAMAPGALQFITYNEFRGSKGINVMNDDTYKQGVLVDPATGISFDYMARFDCGVWHFQLKLAHDLIGLPNDLFSADDRMEGVKWVNRFVISNA